MKEMSEKKTAFIEDVTNGSTRWNLFPTKSMELLSKTIWWRFTSARLTKTNLVIVRPSLKTVSIIFPFYEDTTAYNLGRYEL